MKIPKISYTRTKLSKAGIEIRPYRQTDFKSCKRAHENRLKDQNQFDHAHQIGEFEGQEIFNKFVKKSREHGKLGVHFLYGIFRKKDNAYLGQVDLLTINAQLSWANLGYYIYNQFWGQGYATLASTMALEIAFKQLGFHRVEAAMELRNRASMKVAQKAGLEYEGRRKKFFAHNGGVDFRVYGANSIDFKKGKKR